jgi:hypothetical protein
MHVCVPDAAPVMPTCLLACIWLMHDMFTLFAVSAIQEEQQQMGNPKRAPRSGQRNSMHGTLMCRFLGGVKIM